MPSLNRREFLNTASSLAAGSLAMNLATRVHAAGAAEDLKKNRPPVKLAVMGVNSRGKQLLPGFCSFPEVEIAYICDPDSETIPSAVKIVEEAGKPTPKIEKDFRVALDDRQVTALVCSAPDHWHALATILACQAGKDVYVEKPCCHNPIEGQRMVAAARKYNRVVQVGTQRRSGSDMAALVDEVQSGRLGKVNFVRCWINSVRPASATPSPRRPPTTSTSISGAGRRPIRLTAKIWFITTGIGAGTTAPGNAVTTAFTPSTSPAGDWVSIFPKRSRARRQVLF